MEIFRLMPNAGGAASRGKEPLLDHVFNKEETNMIITLKDGSKKEYAQAMSAYDIARDISDGLARAACVAEVDGKVVDLRTVVDKDCTLNI